jgi:osmotically-inducible protein OsmY
MEGVTMQKMIFSLMTGCLFAGSVAYGQSTQPDNTKANKGDQSSVAVTADQQKNNKPDREMAKEIRKAIVDDGSLSTYAHNVKVIVRNGNVTLRGPVHSDDEKKTVESYAVKVAGSGNVTNDMTVKGDSDADRSKQ